VIRLINAIDGFLMQLEKLLLFLFCLCLTGIMVTQVVLRYFFGAPLFWAEEVSVQFLIFMTVFGVSYLTKLHQHISIDFILEQLNAKGRAGVEWLLGLFMLLLMGLLCFYAWEWILRPDVQLEKSGTTGLPKWYTYAAFPIALSFLCWHQLTRLLNQCFPQPGREAL